MTGIQGKDGSYYQYNESLGVIIKDGIVQSTTEYEPLYIPGTDEFSGVYDKMAKKVISMSGDIGDLKNNSEII